MRPRRRLNFNDLIWLTNEEMMRLKPYFPRRHGRERFYDEPVPSMPGECFGACSAKTYQSKNYLTVPYKLSHHLRKLPVRDWPDQAVGLPAALRLQ